MSDFHYNRKRNIIALLTLLYILTVLFHYFFSLILSPEYLAVYAAEDFSDTAVGCVDDCMDSLPASAPAATVIVK